MNEQANEKPAKKAIYKRWWFWVIMVVLFFAFVSAFNGNDKPTTTANTQEAVASYTFDVPSLLGKNVDEIKSVLGAPAIDTEPTEANLSSGLTKEWEKTFKKDGQTLLVTYRLADRSVVDFFISTPDPSGATKDIEQLKKIGNIKVTDTRYKIEFVKALTDKSQYTGLKITPTGL